VVHIAWMVNKCYPRQVHSELLSGSHIEFHSRLAGTFKCVHQLGGVLLCDLPVVQHC
jgi:hypothetical protein